MPETLSALAAAVRAHAEVVAPGSQEAVVTILGPGQGESTAITVRLDRVPPTAGAAPRVERHG